jgi:hypothetical protein
MTQNFQILLPITALLFLCVILLASVLRRPFTSTKITFFFFSIFFLVWNLLEIVIRISPDGGGFTLTRSVLSHLTLYALSISALHFPFYSRRETTSSFFIAFIGGIGYLVILLVLYVPTVEQQFPVEAKFYSKIIFYLSRSFDLICMVSVLATAFFKLTSTVPKLRNALYTGLGLVFVTTILVGIYNFELNHNKDLLSSSTLVLYLDLLLLIFVGISVLQFKVLSFYPGILSIFQNGEIPKLMIQKTASANQSGAAQLKEELWRFYEAEHWSGFLSEFWFGIIVDETLGNALLHGGKRADDELIVQIFESNKFLDFYVIDMGKGFDPTSLDSLEEGDTNTGKGIYILKKLFQVDWNFLGNEVRVRVSKNPNENPKDDKNV